MSKKFNIKEDKYFKLEVIHEKNEYQNREIIFKKKEDLIDVYNKLSTKYFPKKETEELLDLLKKGLKVGFRTYKLSIVPTPSSQGNVVDYTKLEQLRDNLSRIKSIKYVSPIESMLEEVINKVYSKLQEESWSLWRKISINTWRDLANVINEAGFRDDEGGVSFNWNDYFSKQPNKTLPTEVPIFNEKTNAIACYWVVGDSEGFYVHIQGIESNDKFRFGKITTYGLTGKFWTKERAEDCVRFAQEVINHFF
jgi:hypothetical protein